MRIFSSRCFRHTRACANTGAISNRWNAGSGGFVGSASQPAPGAVYYLAGVTRSWRRSHHAMGSECPRLLCSTVKAYLQESTTEQKLARGDACQLALREL